MDFEQAYKNLNEQQREAVDYIDGPLLVIAGPGTGKTQLLSVRVANILKNTDASPENILCLTFTDAAADNMRHRLAGFIGTDAYKVHIHTYHSFGSYILQENRPELENGIDKLDQLALVKKIQSELKITSPLRGDWCTDKVLSTIGDFKKSAIDVSDIEKIIKRNQSDNETILEAIKDDLDNTKAFRYPKNLPYYENILKTLEEYVRKNSKGYIADRVEPIANIYYRSLAQIFIDRVDEESIAKPLGEWRKQYFAKDDNDNFIFKDVAATLKLADLAYILGRYDEELKKTASYDYNDMILMAIDLLKNNDSVRYDAQERFQYILLDEYQDTNDAQSQLVALLTDNPGNEGRPNIMAVGDDDQAIYGFQGANTSNFFDYDEKYHPKHILLNQNYRSSAEILELAHDVIEQGEDRFCKAPNVNIDKTIIAANPPEETRVEYREFKTYQAEYSSIAHQIRALLDKGVQGNKIAVIAPKHKHLASIMPYLHALDILVSYEKRENILDNPKIDNVMQFCEFLLKLAKNPQSTDEYCFHIFSLEAWNIDTATMLNLISGAHANHRSIIEEMLDEKQPEEVRNAAEFCVKLAAQTNTRSAEFFINAVANKLYTDYNDYDFYSNLNTLRECIVMKGNRKLNLAEFCERIHAYGDAGLQILDHSPYHEAEDAVVVQTVHSSKGLEYDYVFMIAVDNDNWSDAKGNTDHLTLPRNLEYVHHTGDSADEKLRVFFVAITRAKKELRMSYSSSDFTGHNRDRLKFLDTYEKDGKIYSRVIPKAFCEVIPSTTTEIEPKIIAPDNWFDKYVPTDEVRKNLYRPKVAHFRLSPTHLNAFTNLEYDGGPLSFFISYIIGVRGESSFNIEYGNLVHEVMDRLNKDNLSNEDAFALYQELVEKADTDEDTRRDLRDRGAAELPSFLEFIGDQLRNTKAESERSFFSENIVIDDVLLGGKIDRVEIDEENKTITVSDFKTSKPSTKWNDAKGTFKYKTQLYFYKFLIENSRSFANYKVTTGRIDFVKPDTAGHYHSLTLEFDDEEGERIKQLIKVVYQHIQDLDFPDTSEYADTMEFIEHLLGENS